MRIKQDLFASYKTHKWCSREEKWKINEIPELIHCRECGNRLRNKPRCKRYKDPHRWDNAY